MTTRRDPDTKGKLPPWIAPTQYAALQHIIIYMDRHDFPYVASGGLAGNLHGSRWPLQDIDLDLPRAALDILRDAHRTHVRFGPAQHVDDEFDIELLTLDLLGVHVDLTASESIQLRAHDTGRWMPWPSRLDDANVRCVGALRIRVQPLASVIAYKQRIGRVIDVAERRALVGA